MTRMLSLAFAVIALCACSGAAHKPLDKPMPEPDTRAYRACASDADCVIAQNGCCDCMNGGDDIAVRKDELDAFRAQFACANVACTEIGGACGTGEAVCEAGLCTYRPPATP